MYWPIGLPRIYAASSSKAEPGRIFESEDDAESRVTTEISTLNLEDTSSSSTTDSIWMAPATPSTPHITRVDDVSSLKPHNENENVLERSFRQIDKGPIRDVKISRTGHLFATITSTTLTIWQTKVFPSLTTRL